jgi:hypothetical protein
MRQRQLSEPFARILPVSFRPSRYLLLEQVRPSLNQADLTAPHPKRPLRGDVSLLRNQVVWRRGARKTSLPTRQDLCAEVLVLALYAERGRFLDSLTLTADRLPARAAEMAGVIESFVRVVKDIPGR